MGTTMETVIEITTPEIVRLTEETSITPSCSSSKSATISTSSSPLPPLISWEDVKRSVIRKYSKLEIKKRLHEAVKLGDIDLVEELLDEPAADINAVYYGESLLWTAIMNKSVEMARFLIDNGVDTEFKSCRIEIPSDRLRSEGTSDNPAVTKVKLRTTSTPPSLSSRKATTATPTETPTADVYVVSCRQLAYEKGLDEIVKLIDFKQGNLLRSQDPPKHIPRLLQSPERRLRLSGLLPSESRSEADTTETESPPVPRTLSRYSRRQSPFIPPITPVSTTRCCFTPVSRAMTCRSVCSRKSPDKDVRKQSSIPRTPSLFGTASSARSHRSSQSQVRLTKTVLARQNTSSTQRSVSSIHKSLQLKHDDFSTKKGKTPRFNSEQNYLFEQRINRVTNHCI